MQPRDRVYGGRARGNLRLGRAGAGSAGVWEAEKEKTGTDSRLRGECNGVERVATDAADPELLGQWEGGGKALPSPQISGPLHGGGHSAAGRRGPGPRTVERAGHLLHPAAGVGAVRPTGIRTAGGGIGGTSIQLARQRRVPQIRGSVRADAAQRGFHCRAAAARSRRSTRVPARGHGASGGLEWDQGRVPHQRGGHRYAMASGWAACRTAARRV